MKELLIQSASPCSYTEKHHISLKAIGEIRPNDKGLLFLLKGENGATSKRERVSWEGVSLSKE